MDKSESSLRESLKVVAGNPSPEELAAAIAVLEAVKAEDEANALGYERPLKSTWSRNSGMFRAELAPGPGQWRAASRRGLN